MRSSSSCALAQTGRPPSEGHQETPRAEITTRLKHHFDKLTDDAEITYEELTAALDFVRFITLHHIFCLWLTLPKLNECVAPSDSNIIYLLWAVFGLETLVDQMGQCPPLPVVTLPTAIAPSTSVATPSAIRGPFHLKGAPILDNGASVVIHLGWMGKSKRTLLFSQAMSRIPTARVSIVQRSTSGRMG